MSGDEKSGPQTLDNVRQLFQPKLLKISFLKLKFSEKISKTFENSGILNLNFQVFFHDFSIAIALTVIVFSST